MTERKRPLWPFVTVALISLSLYVASVGPAVVLTQEGYLNETVTSVMYAPLWLVVGLCPPSVTNALLRYLEFCGVNFTR